MFETDAWGKEPESSHQEKKSKTITPPDFRKWVNMPSGVNVIVDGTAFKWLGIEHGFIRQPKPSEANEDKSWPKS